MRDIVRRIHDTCSPSSPPPPSLPSPSSPKVAGVVTADSSGVTGCGSRSGVGSGNNSSGRTARPVAAVGDPLSALLGALGGSGAAAGAATGGGEGGGLLAGLLGGEDRARFEQAVKGEFLCASRSFFIFCCARSFVACFEEGCGGWFSDISCFFLLRRASSSFSVSCAFIVGVIAVAGDGLETERMSFETTYRCLFAVRGS